MCLLPSLKGSSTVSFLGIVQWDFTRRDHPRNPRRVSGSGPVIAYAMCRLSRYTDNPNNDHCSALARLMKYLRGTMNYGILYSGFPIALEGYSDANWIFDSDEIKSTNGYVFTLGAGVVAWKSSKQTLIATSTMESEFIALESTGKEAEWLRNFLSRIPLGIQPTP